MQSKYLKLINNHEACLKKNNSIFNIVGYIKLILIPSLGVSIYSTVFNGFSTWLVLISMILLAVLIGLWTYHIKLHEKINCLNGLIAINKRHIARITGEWTAFEDIGAEFIDTEHAYGCDLDIVGHKSVFKFINTTNTWHGRQAFAADLLHPAYSREELQKRQAAVSELSKDIEASNYLQYQLSKIGVNDSIVKLINELQDKKSLFSHKSIKLLLTYIPLVTFIFIAGMLIFQLESLYAIGAALAAIQAVIWIAGMLKTQRYLGTMAHLPYRLNAYSDAIELVTSKDYTSEKLAQIKELLEAAAQAIKELGKISEKINVKHNAIIWFVLNVLLLWDYECAFMLEGWKSKHSDLSNKWFLALGEFESLLSLSNLPNVCNNTCLPAITGTDKAIDAKALGHPLLSNEIRVNNDFTCRNNIFIISGSNMSGKTTFLRTVGVNMVLANTGGFVCAKQMNFIPLKIITSMRIADDLNQGVSTFYAELKRIKSIIELAKNEPDMIFLIDEIFRGTNSTDRLTGTKTVMVKLHELNAAGLISTHDLELCELANEYAQIENYSFSEYYKDGKIYFDYKIRPGISNITNAKYLMEMVGII